MGKSKAFKNFRNAAQKSHRQMVDSFTTPDETSMLPLEEAQAKIRQGLKKNGTNVEMNDSDPLGDGDQSPVRVDFWGKQFYRDLFARGGDIANVMTVGMDVALSEFACACIRGQVTKVKSMLDKHYREEGFPDPELIKLLETREMAIRQSPLMMVISLGKTWPVQNSAPPGSLDKGQVEVVKLLLKYGARPDVKDVCGKTVCHYGMGQMATSMTIEAADLCIEAYKSSNFFGKEVELHSLKNQDMNGKRGIAKGFVDGRRAVYVYDHQKIVAIKPENLKPIDSNDIEAERPKLCDIQDRLGQVCMLELILSYKRVDVTKHLLKKHDARVDIADWDGYSPKSMAMMDGAGLLSEVAPLIAEQAMRQARAEKKAAVKHCSLCGKSNVELQVCARCKTVQYCSKDCQVKDWKDGHKTTCKPVDAADQIVVLEKSQTRRTQTTSYRTQKINDGDFQKPSSVNVGEKFYVKVQALDQYTPLLIYDKTRECAFELEPNQKGHRQLYEKVQAETATQGLKSFFKATFDSSGKMSIYLAESSIKTW